MAITSLCVTVLSKWSVRGQNSVLNWFSWHLPTQAVQDGSYWDAFQHRIVAVAVILFALWPYISSVSSYTQVSVGKYALQSSENAKQQMLCAAQLYVSWKQIFTWCRQSWKNKISHTNDRAKGNSGKYWWLNTVLFCRYWTGKAKFQLNKSSLLH